MTEKIRVLYVDDEQYLLDLGKVFLERSGNFVVTTSTGAPEALRMLELARFDAIISDYQMPEMDGIEFLKVIRGRGDTTPFIIFTGKGREEVVIEALNSGADHYIQKGGEPKSQFAELEHKIRRAVEHQRDETSLQKSQVQLSEAMDLAHIVNWEFDVASGIFTFNDRFYALYGTTAEREGGYQMPADVYAREFVHPDERGLVADEVQNAIHATDPDYTRQIEHRIIRRDGEIRHIIVRFGITKDARGSTVKTHGANQDITDRKRAEESLQKSEERYRALFDGINNGVAVYEVRDNGRDFIFKDFNRAGERIDNDKRERLIGKSLFAMRPGVEQFGLVEVLRRVWQTGKPESYPVALYTDKQLTGWYDNYIYKLPSGEIVAVFDNIATQKKAEAALRESEERYRAIVEDQTEFICRFTPDGRLTFVNAAYCRYFDLDKDQCLARPQLVLLPPEDAQIMKKHLASLTPQNPVAAIEHRIIMSSGEIRWQRWNDRAIFGENGKVIEYQSVGRDITEIKNAEKSLIEREAYYRTIFENTGTASVILEEDTTISLANAEFANLCGYSREEIEGKKRWTEFVVKEDLDWMLAQHHLRRKERKKAERNYEFRFVRKNREIRTIYLSIDVIPGTKKSIASLLDITERKRAEDAIHTFSAYNRSLIDASLDPLVTIDDSCRISDVNLATEQATGYSREELIGTDFSDYFTELKKAKEGYLRVFTDGTVRDYPLEIRHKDGHITPVQYNATVFRDQEGNVRGVFAAARDITERKKAEEALRESENRFHVLFEQSPIPYQSLDADGRFLEANDAWLKSLGYTREEAIGHWFGEFLAPEQVELFRQRFPIFKQVGRVNNVEFLMQRKDGSRILASFDGRIGHHPDGSFRQTHCVWRDITEQRHAEEALRISEEKYRNVFDWANDAILLHTMTVEGSPGRFIEVNQVACRMLGYSKEELLSMGPVDIVPLTLHPQLGDIIRQAQTKDSFLIESRILRKDGTTVPVESSIHFVNYQGKRIWISHIRDITERKQVETELTRVNRALRMLTDSNQALVHNTDEALLMNEICRIAVEVGSYRMAWIGFAEQDEAKTVRPVAHAGFESGYIESAHITWADSERGRGPGGTAIRTGQLSMARNISMDPAFAPWRADAIVRGYQSVIVLPLNGEGRTFGALAIYAREPDAFNTEEVEILKELAGDLAFGITALRTRVKRDQAEETIRDLNAYNRSLIEASPDPLVTIDDNGRISDVNLATEQATGFSSEELIGTDFSDYFTEPEKAKEGYLRVFTDGTVRDYPLEIRHKDGHITPVQYNATVYRDQDGNVRGVFAAARDVTERNKAEGALKESENTLNAVIRGSPIPQFVIDSSHRVIHWNAALEEHSGINANEIIGTNQQWRAFYTHERPCMADLLVDGAIEKIPRWYEGKYSKSSRIEGAYEATDFFPHMGPSGVWLYFTAAPIRDIDGRVIGAVETLEDITGRKNAEITVQKLLQFQNSALMNANVLLFVIDPQGIVKIWNKAAERITGYKAGEVVGSNTIWRQLYPEKEYRQQITGTILRIIKNNNFLENFETLVLCRNGDKKTISWNTRAITDETAELSGYIAIGIDITERKMAEEALKESENRFRQVAQSACEWIWETDADGLYTYTSPAVEMILGYRPDEIVGRMHFYDLFAPEEREELKKTALEAFAKKESLKGFVNPNLHKNGTCVILETSCVPHQDDKGRLISYRGADTDITERKKAEEVLRESREQYKQLVENISDVIFTLDLKGTITYISPVVQRLSGYTAPEVIGQHFTRFVHHEDLPRVIEGFRRRVEGVYGANEFRILTKDGSERYVRTTQTPMIKDGVVASLHYTMTDFSERRKTEVALKESEERYRTIIDTAQEGIWALDRNFHINYINETMAGMLGYTQNEMLGRSFTEFIPEDELPHANVQMELRRAGVWETYELRFRHQNGDILTMLTSSSTLYGPDRTFSGSFSMFTDITERKRAEEALRQVYKKLNLLASITRHDILNQLLALDGYLELSQDSLGDPQKLSEFIKKAQQAAATIEKQITFTRDYQEMGVNAPGWQNVKAGIAQAQERLPLKDVSISVDSRDLEIFADPLFLKVFYNLFDNALRHGGEQLTSVHITSQESDTSLTIICEDDGVGIPVEDKKKLFRKGFGKHTGLGLFLSREILSITGITITENGIPGKGARFEITVPKGMYRLKGAHE